MLHIPIVHAHDVSKHIPREKIFHRVENVIKQLVHMSAGRSSRYEALGKFREHSERSGQGLSRVKVRSVKSKHLNTVDSITTVRPFQIANQWRKPYRKKSRFQNLL